MPFPAKPSQPRPLATGNRSAPLVTRRPVRAQRRSGDTPSERGLVSGRVGEAGLPAQQLGAPWSPDATTATDCTFHQIAPYIGRIKTTIARSLIEQYTLPGDLVVDPFCGSGVIPLEASLAGRRVLASDTNPYGLALTRAKLLGPLDEVTALRQLERARAGAERRLPDQDLRAIPRWVRVFFHPTTLRNALALRDELVARRDWFLLACLLGILHHQRPGFLSFPSSHLVPYLRDQLFPRERFPELYEERDVYVRMHAKVHRTFRRPPGSRGHAVVSLRDSRRLTVPTCVNAVITSPPYMNELDYIRDNRLRLWFLGRRLPPKQDILKRNREHSFRCLMTTTLGRIADAVVPGGAIVLIVGDASRGVRTLDSADVVRDIFQQVPALSRFDLCTVIADTIPDLRRSRRDLRGTKRETVLVYRRQKVHAHHIPRGIPEATRFA